MGRPAGSKNKPSLKVKHEPGEKHEHSGMPRVWDRDAVLAALLEYIRVNDIPIACEFAVSIGMHRSKLYRMPELAEALELLSTKKEAMLERKGLALGEINTTMAIFSLKQLGWTDRSEVAHSGEMSIVSRTPEERDARIAELLAKLK
jgi:hypothetical protein